MRKKALVLFSGGLDSLLSAKILKEQGIVTEGLYLENPFITTPKEKIKKIAQQIPLKIHFISPAPGFYQQILNPQHGRGKNLNPCLDCRLYLFKVAKLFAKNNYFLASGEVLGERPFSQTKASLTLLDKKSALVGKILRPLSAALLPQTQMECQGLVKREKLLGLSGRSRKPQLALAKKWHLKGYLTPAGGCLLTDLSFCRKAEYFFQKKILNQSIIELLKVGRHFDFQNTRVVIGRNQKENHTLISLALQNHWPHAEIKNYPSPVGVIFPSKKPLSQNLLKSASTLVAFYSDVPPKKQISLRWQNTPFPAQIIKTPKSIKLKPI